MGSKPRRKSKPTRQPRAASTKSATPQQPVETPSDAVAQEQSEITDAKDEESSRNDGSEEALEAVVASQETVYDNANDEHLLSLKEPPMTLDEAQRVVERLFVVMLAARLSPLSALSSSMLLDDVLEGLESQGTGDEIELSPQQRRALGVFIKGIDLAESANMSPLQELAAAATFAIEMLEFQIRQAILDHSGNKARGKVDTQLALTKLASSLPADATTVTSKDFERVLEEKLGVTASSSLLVKVVFARIVCERFAPTLPKYFACARANFFAALETFVMDKPLSLDSVEGQLRHLVTNHADLRASFQALDADGSGSLSVDEFVAFLEREAHMHYPHEVLRAFIQRFDVDGDGTLNYDEFVGFVSPKHFGIQVLTPFGMFYQSVDRHELMNDVVAKLKTRMFWMQHNDLFMTSTNPVYKPPLKLKVTDHFILTHHYGTLRLQYKPSDPIAKVLKNGEMVVMVREPAVSSKVEEQFAPFEYRLKPSIKRSIPPLLSWSLRDASRAQAASVPAKSTTTTSHSQTDATRRASLTPGRRRTSMASHTEARSVASSILDASEQLPILSSHEVKRRPTQTRKSSSGQALNVIQPRFDTESKCSQNSPAKTQLETVIPMVPLPQASSSSNEFHYEYDHPPEDNEHDPENESEGSAQQDVDDSFPTVADEGDEMCPTFCVEDTALGCDEDTPPPSYDDG